MTKAVSSALSDITPRGRLEEGRLHDLLGYQLAQASIVTDIDFSREVGTPMDLKRVEFTILQLLKENADVTSTRLAKALAISAPGMTVWLDRLAARGLVRRERSATDARSQHLRLTTAGKSLVTKAMNTLLTNDAASTRNLTPGERALLLELLRKVSHTRELV